MKRLILIIAMVLSLAAMLYAPVDHDKLPCEDYGNGRVSSIVACYGDE